MYQSEIRNVLTKYGLSVHPHVDNPIYKYGDKEVQELYEEFLYYYIMYSLGRLSPSEYREYIVGFVDMVQTRKSESVKGFLILYIFDGCGWISKPHPYSIEEKTDTTISEDEIKSYSEIMCKCNPSVINMDFLYYIPEEEQVGKSFETLYELAQKYSVIKTKELERKLKEEDGLVVNDDLTVTKLFEKYNGAEVNEITKVENDVNKIIKENKMENMDKINNEIEKEDNSTEELILNGLKSIGKYAVYAGVAYGAYKIIDHLLFKEDDTEYIVNSVEDSLLLENIPADQIVVDI